MLAFCLLPRCPWFNDHACIEYYAPLFFPIPLNPYKSIIAQVSLLEPQLN